MISSLKSYASVILTLDIRLLCTTKEEIAT